MCYCYDNAIAIFFLFLHSSHLIQLLNVGVFSPLKAAMKSQLNTIFRTGIARIMKSEWIESYIHARRKAIIKRNIEAGWRATGLWPLDPVRILETIRDISTPPPSISQSPIISELLTSSPPDALSLCSTNVSLNTQVMNAPLATPVRQHIRRLSGIAEELYARNTILQRENTEIKAVLTARKEKESQKRKILKGLRMVTTEDVVKALEIAEEATKEKKKVRKKKDKKQKIFDTSELSDIEARHNDENDMLGLPEEEPLDCIIVERS